MAVSVRLDPVIEAKLTQQAALLGITKSEFIKDAIERALGLKNPATRNQEPRPGKPAQRHHPLARAPSTPPPRNAPRG